MGSENNIKSKSFENEKKRVCGCRHSHFFDRFRKTSKKRFLNPPPRSAPPSAPRTPPTDPPPSSPGEEKKRKGGATPFLRREFPTRDCKAKHSEGKFRKQSELQTPLTRRTARRIYIERLRDSKDPQEQVDKKTSRAHRLQKENEIGMIRYPTSRWPSKRPRQKWMSSVTNWRSSALSMGKWRRISQSSTPTPWNSKENSCLCRRLRSRCCLRQSSRKTAAFRA